MILNIYSGFEKIAKGFDFWNEAEMKFDEFWGLPEFGHNYSNMTMGFGAPKNFGQLPP